MRSFCALALLLSVTAATAEAAPKRKKLYVSLGSIANKANQPAEVVQLVDEQLRAKVAAMGGTLAPKGEKPKAAKALIRKTKARGYELLAELSSLPNGGLRLSLLCFTYPDRALMGEVTVKASGAKPKDLVKALAPKVIEEAAETFEWGT